MEVLHQAGREPRIGEWKHYIFGSAIEAAQLTAVAYYAWTWPKETSPTSTA